MREVTLRPLALFSISFFIFSCILFYTDTTAKLPIAAACFAVSVFLFLLEKRRLHTRHALSLLALAFSCALIFTAYQIDRQLISDEKYAGKAEITGEITEIMWTSSQNGQYIVHISRLDENKVDLKIALNINEVLCRGDIICAKAQIKALSDKGKRRDTQYYISSGATLYGEADSVNLLCKNEGSLIHKLQSINDRLTARFVILLGRENGGLCASLLLGNRTYLEKGLQSNIKDLGLSHVIALSGMHLTVVISLAGFLFSPLPKRKGKAALVLIILFYTALSGFSLSLVRAGVMLILCIAVSELGKASDSITNLGASLLLISLVNPASICDIGLQLSACAMLGIFIVTNKREKEVFSPKKKKGLPAPLVSLADAVVVSAGAMLFTMPVALFYFGWFSLAAIAASIPFSFLTTLMLWLLPFALLFWRVPVLGEVLLFLARALSNTFCFLAEKLSKIHGIVVRIDSELVIAFVLIIIFSLSAAILLDSQKLRKKFQKITFILVVAFIFGTVASQMLVNKSCVLSISSTQSGDAITVTEAGRAFICDISSGSYKLLEEASERAKNEGVFEIESVLIANPRDAHVNALKALGYTMKLRTVYIPDSISTSLAEKFTDCDFEIVKYPAGSEIKFETAKITTYENTVIKRSVRPIIRLKVSGSSKSLLYTGASAIEENVPLPAADLLFLGAYGPKPRADSATLPTGYEKIISQQEQNESFSEVLNKVDDKMQKLGAAS